jgi:hypothetical protein
VQLKGASRSARWRVVDQAIALFLRGAMLEKEEHARCPGTLTALH